MLIVGKSEGDKNMGSKILAVLEIVWSKGI